jgi:O-antigen/teichoic acid export membrane protein
MRDRVGVLLAAARSQLGRNTAAMLVNHGGRACLQGAYFILLARVLGVRDFGAFAGITALVAIVQPFGSLGTMNLLIMHVALDRSTARAAFSTACVVTVGASLCIGAVLIAAAPAITPAAITRVIVLQVVVADLLGARLVDIAGAVYQAQDRMVRTTLFPLVLHAARLVAAIILVVVPAQVTLERWTFAYVAASAVVTVVILASVVRDVGLARPDLRHYRSEWGVGTQFSIGLMAQSIYNDIDKSMLARMSTLEAAGIYSAAYRIVDLSFMPMRALLAASYARFFRHGADGLAASVAFTRSLARPGIAYCLFASLMLFASADFVPLVLGHAYAPSVTALRWLSLLPLLKACHYLAADALTGAMLQATRTAWQVAVAASNVLLNLWLIPAYSWRGAVAASVFSDGVLAVALWLVVRARLRRPRLMRSTTAAAARAGNRG